MTALAAALDARARGWAVLPIQPGGKEPHFSALERVHGDTSWKPLANRPASEPEVRAWFEHDPDAGMGVITGQASGGLVVADIDRPDRARGLQHPPTPTVRARRGPHLYFWTGEPVATTATPWGELRGDGSYIVTAPSLHETGHSYEWALAPDDVPLAPLSQLRSDGAPLSLLPYLARGTSDLVPKGGVPETARLGGDRDALARLDEAVMAALATLGVHVELGRKFPCVLPGHGPDRHPSASLLRGLDGVWRYRDWHHRPDEPGLLTLAELRASLGAGRVVGLRGPSQALWYRRLFYEAGMLPATVAPIAVPEGCSPSARRVAEGFALLLALRELGDGGPAPFSRRFAAAWCGLGERQAGEGIAELRRAGVLVRTAQHGRTGLYEPAEEVAHAAT